MKETRCPSIRYLPSIIHPQKKIGWLEITIVSNTIFTIKNDPIILNNNLKLFASVKDPLESRKSKSKGAVIDDIILPVRKVSL
jgi:hypothetical protein